MTSRGPTRKRNEIGDLVEALFGLYSVRRELQRLAGVEHAVAAVIVLSTLDKTGPVRISDIARGLQVDLSVVSRHLHALQEKGLVERIGDPRDRRSSLVAISPAGREKLEAAHRRLVEGLTEAVADWTPAQIATLADGLVRLHATLGDLRAAQTTSNRAGRAGAARKEAIE